LEKIKIRKSSGMEKTFPKRHLPSVALLAFLVCFLSGALQIGDTTVISPDITAVSELSSVGSQLDADYLVPIGRTAGIKIYAGGILIVEFSEYETEAGLLSPARDGGLKVGDLITDVGGVSVKTMQELQAEISKYSGLQVTLSVLRGSDTLSLAVIPREDPTDGSVKIGAWVRDSMAGIGTITFYDPESGVFGALGHGITDSDTGMLMPLGSGSLIPSSIVGINKSEDGKPGELIGIFDTDKNCGSLYGNYDTGLFGTLNIDELYPDLLSADPIPVGDSDTVVRGSAYILSNIAGDSVEKYEIEIIKIINADRSTKNLYIRVTDPVLLSKTGGIVQGMSGSPIIQNDCIIGAVTHVLINDPVYGYGILIENMLEYAASDETLNAA